MADCCCDEPDVSEDREFGHICKNCQVKTGDIQFEMPLYEPAVYRIRKKKFVKLILSKNLPWNLRESLIDIFDYIENKFMATRRSNFINLEALTGELLTNLGYDEHAGKFKKLKTKSRKLMVKKFVSELMDGKESKFHYLHRLNEIDFVPLKSEPFIYNNKVWPSAIYSDRGNRFPFF